MASEADKQEARRLVEIGYAIFVPLSVSNVTVEITDRGRAAKVLADFGMRNPDFCAIEPQFSRLSGQWVIKVSTVSGPAAQLEIADCYELVGRLMKVGAIDIARQF